MKAKVGFLIFLVVFSAVATSFVLGLPISQMAEANVDVPESYSIAQIDDEVGVDPNGDPKDGPPMPG